VEEVLVGSLRLSRLVIGHDHRFGKDREGSYNLLQNESRRFGFEMEEIPALDLKNISISSSRIRKALLQGDIQVANEFLGYRFFMRGSVIQGDKIGRTINFPTANIFIEENYKLIPAEGVYAVKVNVGRESFSGMLNIGRRPTLPGKQVSMEVHLLNFNRDIYGENIQLNFVKRIRDEVRFDNLSLLEAQLKKDRETVKLILE
jgi:riboflavin kinase/FMN adenylyltransferase